MDFCFCFSLISVLTSKQTNILVQKPIIKEGAAVYTVLYVWLKWNICPTVITSDWSMYRLLIKELFIVQWNNTVFSHYCSSKECFLTADWWTHDGTKCEVSEKPTLGKKATHPPHPQQNFTSSETQHVIITNLEQKTSTSCVWFLIFGMKTVETDAQSGTLFLQNIIKSCCYV